MFLCRCDRADGLVRGGAAAGEVSVRAGGVLPDPVPQPAHQVRQAAAQTALPQDRVRLCDRAALLRQTGGQDSHRDPHQGHAPLGQHLPVAHPGRGLGAVGLQHVTQRSAQTGGSYFYLASS